MAIPIVTLPTIYGHEDAKPLGIVSAQCAFGMNIFKDIATAWRDVVGGRAQSLQNILSDSRNQVLSELEVQAKALGANAIVGLDLDITEFSTGHGMVIVMATGTAIRWGDVVATEEDEPDYRSIIKSSIDAFGGHAPPALMSVHNGFERKRQIAGIEAAIAYVTRDIRKQAIEAKLRFGSRFRSEADYFLSRTQVATAFPAVDKHFENLTVVCPHSLDEWLAVKRAFIEHFDKLTAERDHIRLQYEKVAEEIERGVSMARNLQREHGDLLQLAESYN